MTLDGGSLGSWIDEERSKVRESVRTAEHMERKPYTWVDIISTFYIHFKDHKADT